MSNNQDDEDTDRLLAGGARQKRTADKPSTNKKNSDWFISLGFAILIFLFILVIILVSMMVSMNFQISHLMERVKTYDNNLRLTTTHLDESVHAYVNEKVDAYDSVVKKFQLTTLADGKISLDINADIIRIADVVRFPKPKTYRISQTTANRNRVWSARGMIVYVGDSISWTWTLNENIVECDSQGNLLTRNADTMYSGPLGKALPGDTYTFQFNAAGRRYYRSENSLSMDGVVLVKVQPPISLDRETNTGS